MFSLLTAPLLCGCGGGGAPEDPRHVYVRGDTLRVDIPGLDYAGPVTNGRIGGASTFPGQLELPASPANDAGATALNRAERLQALLQADVVFRGVDLGATARKAAHMSFREGRDRQVRVTHVFSGPRELEGHTVRVRWPGDVSADTPRPFDDTILVIYTRQRYGALSGAFWSRHVRRKTRAPQSGAAALAEVLAKRYIRVKDTYPLDEAARVVADLRTRTTLPTRVNSSDPEGPPIREIVFDGTLAEAFLAIDCEDRHAALHAQRGLELRAAEARTPVLREIERRLFDTAAGNSRRNAGLRRLIEVLGGMETTAREGTVDPLIQAWIRFLDADEQRSGAETYHALNSSNVNRALYWLLRTLEPRAARARYGSRLQALAASTHGGWRREVGLIVADLQVRAVQELPSALERGAAARRAATPTSPPSAPRPSTRRRPSDACTVCTADGNWQYEIEAACLGWRAAEVVRIDLRSGARVTLPVPGRTSMHQDVFGLVPGGRYLYFASPDVLILDRKDLTIISDWACGDLYCADVAFATDGAHYAYAAEAEDYPVEVRDLLPEGTTHILCVHDTRTGTPQLAIPLAGACKRFVLDAKGAGVTLTDALGHTTHIR